MKDNACMHIAGTPEHIGCKAGHNAPNECCGCPDYSPMLSDEERTRAEIWTRVMGYHRPISAFNAGKLAEHRDRKPFAHFSLAEGAGHD